MPHFAVAPVCGIVAWVLPTGSPGDRVPSPRDIERLVERLLAARERVARRPAGDVISVLDRVAEAWLAPDSPRRRRAERVLAASTGFSLPMIRRGLPRLIEPLRPPAIEHLLDRELGDRWRRIPASGPRLIVHVLPGNIPALAATALSLSLAVRAAALVKPGAGDPACAALWVQSIIAEDEELGACAAAVYWQGGAEEIERAAFEKADVVDATGSDEAIAALRSRVPGRFVGRGNRMSFAFVGAEVASDPSLRAAAARAIGEDVSLWDQRGCLSPQVVLVEGDRRALHGVGEELAAALRTWATELPPRPLSLEERAAVLRFRQELEWEAMARQKPVRLLCGESLTWTVAVEGEAALRPTCLHRTLRVQPVASPEEAAAAARLVRPWLEAAGLAVSGERFDAVEAVFRAAGVPRVCPAGEMQRPDLSWQPGGQPRVAAWFSESMESAGGFRR